MVVVSQVSQAVMAVTPDVPIAVMVTEWVAR